MFNTGYYLLDYALNFFIDWHLYVLYYFHLHDLFLNNRDPNLFADFNNLFAFYYSLTNHFDYLWNLNDLLNYPRHTDDLLNNLLNLDYLWNLNYLFYDLINTDSHFFYPFNIYWHFDNLLDTYLYWLFLDDIFVTRNHYFLQLSYFAYYITSFLNLHDLYYFASLRDYFLVNFSAFHESLMENRDLYYLLYFFDDLSIASQRLFDYLLNFTDSIHVYDFLYTDFYLFYARNLNSDLDYLLNTLDHLFNNFDPFDNRDDLLYASFDYYRHFFNMVTDLFSIDIFYDRNELFNASLNLDYHWFLHDSLNNYFNLPVDDLNLLTSLSYRTYLLSDNLNRTYFFLNMTYIFFNIYYLLNLHYFLDNYLNGHDFRALNTLLNDSLDDSWYLHDNLLANFYLDNLLHNSITVLDAF